MIVPALLAAIILIFLVGPAQAAKPTPPATPVISSGPETPTTATSATFVFSSSTDPSTYLCSLDSPRFEACTSPESYSGLTAGDHEFQVEAKNKGRVSPPASWTWTIQLPLPGVR